MVNCRDHSSVYRISNGGRTNNCRNYLSIDDTNPHSSRDDGFGDRGRKPDVLTRERFWILDVQGILQPQYERYSSVLVIDGNHRGNSWIDRRIGIKFNH